MMIGGIFGSYIDAKGMEVLRSYRYCGGGSTPIDRLLNPFWEWTVNQLPLWISPNILTLLGFWCTFLCMALTCICMPTLTEAAPWYIYLAILILLFLYQTLDAVDGKQARRTKTSSPLGQLLDHGCDAFSTIFACITVLGIVRMGLDFPSFLLIAILQMQLLTYSWWELHFGIYRCHTGVLGVTEGQLFMMGHCILALTFGADIFLTAVGDILPAQASLIIPDSLLALKMQTIFAVPKYLLLIGMLSADIFNGCRLVKSKLTAIPQLAGCFLHVIMQFALYESRLMTKHPVLCYWTITFYFCIIALRLNMSSTCKMSFSPIQYPVLPYWVLSICAFIFLGPKENSILNTYSINKFISPFLIEEEKQIYATYCLLFAFMFSGIYLYDFVISTISSICAHLKISCFSIDKKNIDEQSAKLE